MELMDAIIGEWRGMPDEDAMLAFSGGVDSTLLLLAARAACRDPALITLASDHGGRDEQQARSTASGLDLPCRVIHVADADILGRIATHRALLAMLPDYTHRILAVTELLLCAIALLALPLPKVPFAFRAFAAAGDLVVAAVLWIVGRQKFDGK